MDHMNNRNQGDDASRCQQTTDNTVSVKKSVRDQFRLENMRKVIKSELATGSETGSAKPEESNGSERINAKSAPVSVNKTDAIMSQPVTSSSETDNIKCESNASSKAQTIEAGTEDALATKADFVIKMEPVSESEQSDLETETRADTPEVPASTVGKRLGGCSSVAEGEGPSHSLSLIHI